MGSLAIVVGDRELDSSIGRGWLMGVGSGREAARLSLKRSGWGCERGRRSGALAHGVLGDDSGRWVEELGLMVV